MISRNQLALLSAAFDNDISNDKTEQVIIGKRRTPIIRQFRMTWTKTGREKENVIRRTGIEPLISNILWPMRNWCTNDIKTSLILLFSEESAAVSFPSLSTPNGSSSEPTVETSMWWISTLSHCHPTKSCGTMPSACTYRLDFSGYGRASHVHSFQGQKYPSRCRDRSLSKSRWSLTGTRRRAKPSVVMFSFSSTLASARTSRHPTVFLSDTWSVGICNRERRKVFTRYNRVSPRSHGITKDDSSCARTVMVHYRCGIFERLINLLAPSIHIVSENNWSLVHTLTQLLSV